MTENVENQMTILESENLKSLQNRVSILLEEISYLELKIEYLENFCIHETLRDSMKINSFESSSEEISRLLSQLSSMRKSEAYLLGTFIIRLLRRLIPNKVSKKILNLVKKFRLFLLKIHNNS